MGRFRRRHAPARNERELFLGIRGGLFGDENFVLLAATVTLFLQIISFATTLRGSWSYFSGVFFLAPLLFSIAVQATAWSTANSLRRGVGPLRIAAMVLAMCCSSYFSFVGVYHTVNPPERELESIYQQNVLQLNTALTTLHDSAGNKLRTGINTVLDGLLEKSSQLTQQNTQLAACEQALQQAQVGGTSLRAPNRSDYDSYEEYSQAYTAYKDALRESQTADSSSARAAVLSQYGFSSEEAYQTAMAENTAQNETLNSAMAAMVPGEGMTNAQRLEQVRTQIESGLNASGTLSQETVSLMQRTTSLYQQLGGEEVSADSLTEDWQKAMDCQLDLPEYQEIEKQNGTGGLPRLKTMLDQTLTQATRTLETAGGTAPELVALPDPYLQPVYAVAQDLNANAILCLLIAVLVDGLSVLFALMSMGTRSMLLPGARLFSRRGLSFSSQVYAALGSENACVKLDAFLKLFSPSPTTVSKGWVMQAEEETLKEYSRLMALLYQAKLAGKPEDGTIVLLHQRFVNWVGEMQNTLGDCGE